MSKWIKSLFLQLYYVLYLKQKRQTSFPKWRSDLYFGSQYMPISSRRWQLNCFVLFFLSKNTCVLVARDVLWTCEHGPPLWERRIVKFRYCGYFLSRISELLQKVVVKKALHVHTEEILFGIVRFADMQKSGELWEWQLHNNSYLNQSLCLPEHFLWLKHSLNSS